MGRFRDALAPSGSHGSAPYKAIAEVKRRSPSAGDLRPTADPAEIAAAYEQAGAAAVSILVDAERFGGSWDDLRAARAATALPLLAKGFFTTEQDLRTAAEAGADAVLLLLRDLDDVTAARLMGKAHDLGLDAFVEAHDDDELERAAALGADPIGINARDLTTFTIDRSRQLELVARAKSAHHPTPNREGLQAPLIVAESGIWNRAQAADAELAGADAVLVGSSLMKAHDPAAKLADLIARPLVKVCGLTRDEDVACAAEAGADLAGFILAESPRRAPGVLAVPETMLSVAVFVGDVEQTSADLVQLYPDEDGRRGQNGALFRAGRPVATVVDLPWGGDGSAHWQKAAGTQGRVMLAGGLGADNVRAAVEAVRPWAVDAARSLEEAPGIKDPDKVRAFVEAVRA